jgi:hypothetical protein
VGINKVPGLANLVFFLSSSALFAYWLRSSVVSVLFSLISESVLNEHTLIILIFGSRNLTSVLAHVLLHSVTGLTLSPVDANTFHQLFGLSGYLEKMSTSNSSKSYVSDR